ncbi:MAG: Fic family protein [Verrucomicrobiota bacterium]
MATNPQRLLADALRRAQVAAPSHILRTSQLSRRDRVLLMQRGFLVEIIKGWYALTTPQAQPGDTTFWHLHFWVFVSAYLSARYGRGYCLSPEHSLDLWTATTQTPKQLIVLTARGGVFTLKLPNDTSILLYPNRKSLPENPETKQGVHVMPLAMALTRVTPSYFTKSAMNAELALRMVRPEELSRTLLAREVNLTAAGRLIGGLRHLGLEEVAGRVQSDLMAAGLTAKGSNPFDEAVRLSAGVTLPSPYAGRIQAMWTKLRPAVLEHFPSPPKSRPNDVQYLQRVQEIYAHDAYHSLSIEGYQVTPELIQRIADGVWNPADAAGDQRQVNAMAAKGYHEAFKEVVSSLGDVFRGRSPGWVVERDLQRWYRALFSPSVQANIIPASALAGYRDRRVFIRGSEHVPPAVEAVPALMEAFFAALREEKSPAVRAVLGHFIFVFIHPYPDGNGRIARFLMNVMLASGGYNWTVIRVDRRPEYMAALEKASVQGQLSDFTRIVAEELKVSARLKGRQLKG